MAEFFNGPTEGGFLLLEWTIGIAILAVWIVVFFEPITQLLGQSARAITQVAVQSERSGVIDAIREDWESFSGMAFEGSSDQVCWSMTPIAEKPSLVCYRLSNGALRRVLNPTARSSTTILTQKIRPTALIHLQTGALHTIVMTAPEGTIRIDLAPPNGS